MSAPAAPQPGTGILVIGEPPRGDPDVAALCERLRALVVAGDVQVVVCDVRTLAADAASVEALARLHLTARRLGARIRLRRATSELCDLLSFAGLTDVLALGSGGDAEEREHPLRVEERVDRGDLPA